MSKLKFLHLTDTHVLKEENYVQDPIFKSFKEKNYSTTENLKQLFALSENQFQDLDCVFVTGDLVHEGDVHDYSELKELFEAAFSIPVFFVLGNHDRTNAFKEAFEITECDEEDYYYSKKINEIRIVGLDSSYDYSGSGRISQKQLEWLKLEIEKDIVCETIILIHHPLGIISEEDPQKTLKEHFYLQNSTELIDVLKFGNIKGVLSGHTHRTSVSQIQGIVNIVATGSGFSGSISNEYFSMSNRIDCNLGELRDGNIEVINKRITDTIVEDLFVFPLHQMKIDEGAK